MKSNLKIFGTGIRPWLSFFVVGCTLVSVELGQASTPTSGASVSINAAYWADGGCVPHAKAVSSTIPELTGCGGIVALAHAQKVFFHQNEPESICQLDEFTTVSPSYSWDRQEGGTAEAYNVEALGFKKEKRDLGGGTFEFTITRDPEKELKSGYIRIVATADGGQCMYQCAPRSDTWVATGWIHVIADGSACSIESVKCSGGKGDGTTSQMLGIGSVQVSSVDFKLSTGPCCDQSSPGLVFLNTTVPSAALGTPAMLDCPVAKPGMTVVHDTNGCLRQVKSPQGLLDVVVTSNNCTYEVRAYYDSVVSPPSGGSSNYTATGSPFVTWEVCNPGAPNTNNLLKVTEKRMGSSDRIFTYTYATNNSLWQLLLADGTTTNLTWLESAGANSTNAYEEIHVGSQLLSKKRLQYEAVTNLDSPLLREAAVGDGSVLQTTTYQYYSPTLTNGSQNRLLRVDHPDGRWECFKYNSSGQKTVEFSALGTNVPPAAGVEPDPITNLCRMTVYSYILNSTNDGTSDDGSALFFTPRKAITYLPVQVSGNWTTQEVSRSYQRITDTARDRIEETVQCPQPGALWADAGNQHSIAVTHIRAWIATNNWVEDPDSAYDFKIGRPKSASHPDGTATLYDYVKSGTDLIITNRTGEPDNWYSPTIITDGTATVTIVDVLGRTKTVTTSTIGHGLGTPLTLARTTYYYLTSDSLGRDVDVVDLAGRTNTYRYACCGLDYTVDPDGVMNLYEYDVLKRVTGTTKILGSGTGVKAFQVFDNANRVLMTKRTGTDNSVITNSQMAYDILGRVIRQTNALGGVISNLYLTNMGAPREVVLYPDGGTMTNDYLRDGRLWKTTGTAVSPTEYTYGVDQDGGVWREFTLETKLDATGGTSEWTKSYVDGAGRTFKTVYAKASSPYPASQSFYNEKGQLWKQVDPDGVTTFSTYDALGEQEYSITTLTTTAQQITNYSTLVSSLSSLMSGSDRINQTMLTYIAAGGGTPDRSKSETYMWKDGSSSGTLVSSMETSADGLKSWQTTYPSNGVAVTLMTETLAGTNRIVTTWQADNSSTVSSYGYGRLQSVTRKDANLAQVSQTVFGYDPHGRQNAVTDARNGTTTSTYNAADQVTTTASPDPGTGPQLAQSFYDVMGRRVASLLPDGTTVSNLFTKNGLLQKTWGSRTYPVGYGYDAQGRMRYMTNWQNHGGGVTAVTRWNYDAYRGWLKSKDYPDATSGAPPGTEGTTGPTYTYTDAGRLTNRAWLRGVTTTYTLDLAGQQTAIKYTGGTATPAVTNVYDRLGRLKSVVHNGATNSFTYNDANQAINETFSGGLFSGLAFTNGYDTYMRRTSLSLNSQPSTLNNSYGYDADGRLNLVTNKAGHSASYSYLTNSTLMGQVLFKQTSNTRMTTTRQFDRLNRLQSVSSLAAGASAPVLPISHGYWYNSANQRTRSTQADGSYWVYSYDALGQVIGGQKFWSDGSLVGGQQFEYRFDDIGNRDTTGGRVSAQSDYAANRLNQYTSRTNAGVLDILGLANPTAAVKVNGNTAERHGEYFHYPLGVTNATAQYPSVTVISEYGSKQTNSGYAFVPPATEGYVHDGDGNLTQDGRWTYTWDAENRLVQMESLTNGPTGSKLKIECQYDHRWRRTQKVVSTWNGSAYVSQSTNRFVYDGWNLIAILDSQSSILYSFTWGTDASGTMQGAGGVGGLLAMTVHQGTNAGTYFYAYDGNYNVMALVSAADGSVAARYEYGPFGEPLRTTGLLAGMNPFAFSTKYQDQETGNYYYGYRAYNPNTGRWLNRDPIEEEGGANVFGMAGNDIITHIDILGKDFIAVAGRAVRGTLGTLGHYSLQRWLSCPNEEPETQYAISYWTKDHPARKVASVELLASGGWFVGVLAPTPGVRSTTVSVISIGPPFMDNGDTFVSVFTGTPAEVRTRWNVILSFAANYQFAEQGGLAFAGPFVHWPDSKYGFPHDGPFNNSNTFVRDTTQGAGLSMRELVLIPGGYPGNDVPVSVPDIYVSLPYR